MSLTLLSVNLCLLPRVAFDSFFFLPFPPSFLFFLVYSFLFSFTFSLCPVFFLSVSSPTIPLGGTRGRDTGLVWGERGEGCLIFPCAFKQRWESAEEELEGVRDTGPQAAPRGPPGARPSRGLSQRFSELSEKSQSEKVPLGDPGLLKSRWPGPIQPWSWE